MRLTIIALFTVLAYLVAIPVSIFLGYIASQFTDDSKILVGVIFGLMFWLIQVKYFVPKVIVFLLRVGRKNMTQWLDTVKGCTYVYAWDGFGLAINPGAKKIFLASKINDKYVEKVYSFSEMREWSYEIPGVSTVTTFGNVGLNVALSAGIYNMASSVSTLPKIGIYMKMKDIEYPNWFIRFGDNPMFDKKRKTVDELEKWMEIFRQNITHE